MNSPVKYGVVAVICREERLLVIQRSLLVAAPGAFCFPGGAIESGETESDALRRELQEELALNVVPVRRLWQSTTPWNVQLSWWTADLVDSEAQPIPNPQEVAAYHWLPVDEIRALPNILTSNIEFLDAWVSNVFEL